CQGGSAHAIASKGVRVLISPVDAGRLLLTLPLSTLWTLWLLWGLLRVLRVHRSIRSAFAHARERREKTFFGSYSLCCLDSIGGRRPVMPGQTKHPRPVITGLPRSSLEPGLEDLLTPPFDATKHDLAALLGRRFPIWPASAKELVSIPRTEDRADRTIGQ